MQLLCAPREYAPGTQSRTMSPWGSRHSWPAGHAVHATWPPCDVKPGCSTGCRVSETDVIISCGTSATVNSGEHMPYLTRHDGRLHWRRASCTLRAGDAAGCSGRRVGAGRAQILGIAGSVDARVTGRACAASGGPANGEGAWATWQRLLVSQRALESSRTRRAFCLANNGVRAVIARNLQILRRARTAEARGTGCARCGTTSAEVAR